MRHHRHIAVAQGGPVVGVLAGFGPVGGRKGLRCRCIAAWGPVRVENQALNRRTADRDQLRRRQAGLADQLDARRQAGLLELYGQVGRARPKGKQHHAVGLGRHDAGGNGGEIRVRLLDAGAVHDLHAPLLGVLDKDPLQIDIGLVVGKADGGAGLDLGHIHGVVPQLRHGNRRRLGRDEAPRARIEQAHRIGHGLHANLGIIGHAGRGDGLHSGRWPQDEQHIRVGRIAGDGGHGLGPRRGAVSHLIDDAVTAQEILGIELVGRELHALGGRHAHKGGHAGHGLQNHDLAVGGKGGLSGQSQGGKEGQAVQIATKNGHDACLPMMVSDRIFILPIRYRYIGR